MMQEKMQPFMFLVLIIAAVLAAGELVLPREESSGLRCHQDCSEGQHRHGHRRLVSGKHHNMQMLLLC